MDYQNGSPESVDGTFSSRMNVLYLIKDEERYAFLYDDESRATLFSTFCEYAEDKELSFTWYDAAVLSQKVRKLRLDDERVVRDYDGSYYPPKDFFGNDVNPKDYPWGPSVDPDI